MALAWPPLRLSCHCQHLQVWPVLRETLELPEVLLQAAEVTSIAGEVSCPSLLGMHLPRLQPSALGCLAVWAFGLSLHGEGGQKSSPTQMSIYMFQITKSFTMQ